MKNIEDYRNRFFNLMESTMGDVKPIVIESEIGNRILKIIDGSINPYGNHPGSAKVKVDKKIDKGYEGTLVEWNFGSGWGVKVGNKVIVSNLDMAKEKCTLTIPNTKLGSIDLERCDFIY